MMHIESMKGVTKQKKIIALKNPPFVYISLLRDFGSSPEPIVSAGDYVKKYQLIGEAKEGFSAKIHSPVSGKVTEIKEHIQTDGNKTTTIIIENDFQNNSIELSSSKNYTNYTTEELLEIIENAGIVGEGGARFPTAKKYKLDGKKIHTFIVNGAECEPYLTADYSIMKERTKELLEGIQIINKILQAKEIVITFEKDYSELKEVFEYHLQSIQNKNIKIQIVDNTYPQGGELQLTKSVTRIEKEKGKLLADIGVIMNNVNTVYAVYNAVVNNKPLIERVITVSGEESSCAGNYEVLIGTPVEYILKATGMPENESVIVIGGPMMGKYVYDISVPINKGSGGVLLLTKKQKKRQNCILCGYCSDVCPMFLMPMKYEEMYRKRKYSQLEKYSLNDCIDCGSCEYACPCEVPLMESIQKGKAKLKELKNDSKKQPAI